VAAAPESQQRTAVLGLTGAIAAGKSEALAAFERHGAATLSADAVVHDLLGTERVHDLLVGRWGAEVAPNGAVDRGRVATIVFERPQELAWLESTLHPLVGERIAAWRQALDPATPVAVIEVPLLFETGLESAFDATVSVVASDPLRVERAGARGTRDLDQRAERQLSQEEKAKRATYVIRNDAGLDELDGQIKGLMAEVGAMEGDRN
jgi:dephospho-CoA kinase